MDSYQKKKVFQSTTICVFCYTDKLDDDIIEEIKEKYYFNPEPCGDCKTTYRINSIIHGWDDN